jgi:hypothetical protein
LAQDGALAFHVIIPFKLQRILKEDSIIKSIMKWSLDMQVLLERSLRM